MISKNNAPNKAQKDWMAAVRELGSVISGGPAVIHHAVGRTGKHNKVHIGHWWIIPLTDEEHKALHNGIMIWEQSHPDCGIETRKQFEKAAYEEVYMKLWSTVDHYYCPSLRVNESIMDYHR